MTNFDALLRTDVLTFANRAHIELHCSKLDTDWYLRLLAFDIERIVEGHIRRYLCNMPPGSGKTFLLSVTLAAWLLGHKPSARILIASYGEVPALMISRNEPPEISPPRRAALSTPGPSTGQPQAYVATT